MRGKSLNYNKRGVAHQKDEFKMRKWEKIKK